MLAMKDEKPRFKLTVNIRRFVKLLPNDDFTYDTFDKRLIEQSCKRKNGRRRRKLYVMNETIKSVGFAWWNSSNNTTVPLTNLTGLITFKAVPTLLAVGMKSDENPCEKQYVVLHVPSGYHRELLVNKLQQLCQIQRTTPSQSTDEDQSSGRLQSDYGTLSSSPVVVDYRTQKYASKGKGWAFHLGRKRTMSSASNSRYLNSRDGSHSEGSSLRGFSSPIVVFRQGEDSLKNHDSPVESKQGQNPMAGKPGMQTTHLSGMNKSKITYLRYDREKGYVFTDDGPIYLYCERIPVERELTPLRQITPASCN